MTKPILFYSKTDQASINLWNKLKADNILESFIKICVDNNPKIPKIITTVPSIYVKNRPLITGTSIPMYLNSVRTVTRAPAQSRNPVQSRNPAQPNNPAQSNNPTSSSNSKEGESETLNDFNPVEMSNRWSDSYSFIDPNPEPCSFTFQFLNKDSSNTTSSGQQPVPVKQEYQTNKKSDEFQNRLEQMQQDRASIK
jgi:hypothetical protein